MSKLLVPIMMLTLMLASTTAFAATPAAKAKSTFLMGKVEVTQVNGAKTIMLSVQSPLTHHPRNGAAMSSSSLNGKQLTLTGSKLADLEKYAGKTIEVTGMLNAKDAKFEVTRIIEPKAASAHAVPNAAKPTTPPAPASSPKK